MKRGVLTLTALILVVALLLCGCGELGDYVSRFHDSVNGHSQFHYDDMTYTRPDLTALEHTLEESCALARESEDLDAVLDGILAYYEVYDNFYTNLSLAYIRYCGDLTDIYWQQEYDYCSANYAVADAGLEDLYCALAKSPIRAELEGDDYFGPDYFDAYEGGVQWDETFLSYLEQDNALQSQYYDLISRNEDLEQEVFLDEQFENLANILGQLVVLRKEMASYMGYPSYGQFAYDFYHYRSYSPAEAMDYTNAIRIQLSELYRRVGNSEAWDLLEEQCTEAQTLSYARECAKAMGDEIWEAFTVMESMGLYDTTIDPKKMDISFEVYLDSYAIPFVFMKPTGTAYDKLVLVHEFGHFVHDYVCYGSYAGTDVAEVLSQGMEYLSLFYGNDTQELEKLKMVENLCVYVEQAAYATFEHRLYEMAEEDLTPENLRSLYAQVGGEFGLDYEDWDPREFVLMAHYFAQPMYLISYVVSNDVAFQLYILEQDRAGQGLALYEKMLSTNESDIQVFVESMEMENPLSQAHVARVREVLEELLEP